MLKHHQKESFVLELELEMMDGVIKNWCKPLFKFVKKLNETNAFWLSWFSQAQYQ